MKKTLKEIKANYLKFIEQIPDNLDKAKKLLDVDKITFSYDEVDKMQYMYEKNYENPENLDLTYEELADIFDAYVGEAFMFYNGGNWELSKIKNDDAYGTPIILNWGNDGFPHISISPYVWRILIERKLFRETISKKIRIAQIS